MDLKSRWSWGGLLSKAFAMFFRFACDYLGPRDLKTENWIRVLVKTVLYTIWVIIGTLCSSFVWQQINLNWEVRNIGYVFLELVTYFQLMKTYAKHQHRDLECAHKCVIHLGSVWHFVLLVSQLYSEGCYIYAFITCLYLKKLTALKEQVQFTHVNFTGNLTHNLAVVSRERLSLRKAQLFFNMFTWKWFSRVET